MLSSVREPEGEVNIAVVGKYTELKDAYKSLIESLQHGEIAGQVRVNLEWMDAQIFEREDAAAYLEKVNGFWCPAALVNAGLRERLPPRILPARAMYLFRHLLRHADGGAGGGAPSGRHHGCHLDGVRAGRNAGGRVDDRMGKGDVLEKRGITSDLGGTMRLGAYEAFLAEDSRVADIYGTRVISERHRHRYEVNMEYRAQLEEAGVGVFRRVARRRIARNCRNSRTHMVRRCAVSSRIEIAAFRAASAFASFIEAALAQPAWFRRHRNVPAQGL